jgi:hypothetical protein
MHVQSRTACLELRLSRAKSTSLLGQFQRIPSLSFRILRGRMTSDDVWMVVQLQGAPAKLERALDLGRSSMRAQREPLPVS